jgi:hypothetical protein
MKEDHVAQSCSIHLEEQTATSETGIRFKFTEAIPGVFNEVIINPEVIPPDDIDEVILSEMRQDDVPQIF